MNKLVWQDYWKGLSWENVKVYIVKNKGRFVWFLIMFFVVIPQYSLKDEVERGLMMQRLLLGYVAAIPVLFLFGSLALTSIALPKAMYMSPMTDAERKEFIEKKWRLAILVPDVFNIVWAIIGLLLGMDALSLLFLVIHFKILSEGAIFYRNKNSSQFELAMDKAFPVYVIFGMIIAVLIQVFGIVIIMEEGAISQVWLAVALGIMVVLELPLMIKIMSYKKKLIQCMTNYEAAYSVVEKQEG